MFISKWIIIIFLIVGAIVSIFFIYDNMVFNDTNNLKSTPTFLPDEIIEMAGSMKCLDLPENIKKTIYFSQACHKEYYELFNLKKCNYSIKDATLEEQILMGKECYKEFEKLGKESTDFMKEKTDILCTGLSDTNCLEKLKIELQK